MTDKIVSSHRGLVLRSGGNDKPMAVEGESPMIETKRSLAWKYAFWGLILAGGLTPSVGCQVSVAGQTLPSPYYLRDDVQYFPAGPENKIANETAAMKKARAESLQQRR